MKAIHIESAKDDIADVVLMPGDPLRAQYIAQNYLEDYKLVNKLRNMFAYTGTYKGKKVTVMGSGMGFASIGIYAHELYNFYDVQKIIRIGTCGAAKKEINIGDVVLAEKAVTASNYALIYGGINDQIMNSSQTLNESIKNVAQNQNIVIHNGPILSNDIFDPYVPNNLVEQSVPSNLDYLAKEMEAFALFLIAQTFKKESTCLLTVTDSPFSDKVISPEDREKSLDTMITLALESLIY